MVSREYVFELGHETYLVVAGVDAVERRMYFSLNRVKGIKY